VASAIDVVLVDRLEFSGGLETKLSPSIHGDSLITPASIHVAILDEARARWAFSTTPPR